MKVKRVSLLSFIIVCLIIIAILINIRASEKKKATREISSQVLDCPNWKSVSEERKNSEIEFMQKISRDISSNLPTSYACSIPKYSELSDYLETYREVYELSDDLGFSGIKKKYIYHLIPPSDESVKKPFPTIVILKGGPGSVFKGESVKGYKKYQKLLIDYPGLGYNEYNEVIPFETDQLFNQKVFSKILFQIVKNEIDNGTVGRYILQGHSYAAVAATMLSSSLSRVAEQKYRPSGVWLSGWSLFLDVETDSSNNTVSVEPIEYTPKMIDGNLCILPQGSICYDSKVFASVEKLGGASSIKAAVYNLFEEVKSIKDLSSYGVQFFIRESMHHLSSNGPEAVAEYLIKIFKNGSPQYAEMCTWFQSNYLNIPWIKRNFDSSSALAAIYGYGCEQNGKGRYCDCFEQNATFVSTNYQIQNDVPVFVFSSVEDPFTPLEETMKSFKQLKASRKHLGIYCNKGHKFSDSLSFKNSYLSLEEIFDYIFQSPDELGQFLSENNCI